MKSSCVITLVKNLSMFAALVKSRICDIKKEHLTGNSFFLTNITITSILIERYIDNITTLL